MSQMHSAPLVAFPLYLHTTHNNIPHQVKPALEVCSTGNNSTLYLTISGGDDRSRKRREQRRGRVWRGTEREEGKKKGMKQVVTKFPKRCNFSFHIFYNKTISTK
jgi:hypothetical protein